MIALLVPTLVIALAQSEGVAPSPAAPPAEPATASQQLDPACAVGASLGGIVAGDVAAAALGAAVVGGMFLVDQSQGTAFRGAFVAAAVVISLPVAGPLGAAAVLTLLLSASAEHFVLAWQPAVLGVGFALTGAVVGAAASASASHTNPVQDIAFVALGSAFVLSTLGAVVGGIWATSGATEEPQESSPPRR